MGYSARTSLFTRRLLFAFLVAMLPAAAALPVGRPLSLPEALRFAMESSPALDTARKTQLIRELEHGNAVAKILPALDFRTTNGLQDDIGVRGVTGPLTSRASTSPWYSSLGLELTESLYDNGVSLARIAIADLNRDLARESFQKARDSLALEIASEFYRFSLASALLEVRRQQQEILEKQLRSITSQYQQGFKTKSDYLRFQTQVRRAEIDRVAAENGIVQSEAGLRKLLGVSYRDAAPPAFEPARVDKERKGLGLLPARPPALEGVFDYRIARIQERIDAKNAALVRKSYWPQLLLSSGLSYANQGYLNSRDRFSDGGRLSWNALLTLQYNIWDWGSRRRDVEIAEYQRGVQENELSRGLLEVNAQIAGLMADISRVSRNYELARDLLRLEEESNRDLQARYREGKVAYLDLVTGLSNLLDAKVQFFTSYFDALTSRARHRYYEGTLYESLLGK